MFLKTFILAVLAVGVLADGNKGTFHSHVAGLFKLGAESDASDEECIKLGLSNKFDAFEDTMDAVYMCAMQLIDHDTPLTETDDAKRKVLAGQAYAQPCRKLPEFKSCVENVLTNMTSCDVAGARTKGPIAKKVAQEIIDYTCTNGGEKVSNFITSDGPQCYASKIRDAVKCMTKSDDPDARIDNFLSDDTLSKEEKCTKFTEFSTCIVESMKKCPSQTPSEILAGIFATLSKATSCTN